MRSRFSTAFWIVTFVIFMVVDMFVTPAWMNHHHGSLRLIGFLIGGLSIIPTVAVAIRTYQYITLKLFVRSIDHDD